MSAKFTLTAGALLLSARFEMHAVTAALDPSAPVTIVTPDLAERIGAAEHDGDIRALNKPRVVGIDHAEMTLRQVTLSRDGTVVIGADVLNQMVLRLDFRRNRLRVVDQGDYRKATANLIAVPVSVTPDGCLSVAGTAPDGRPVRAALIGGTVGETPGDRAILQTGEVVVEAHLQPAIRRQCAANDMLVTWQSFEGQAITLDLRRGQIWLQRNAWSGASAKTS
jgi:hypothetical protein